MALRKNHLGMTLLEVLVAMTLMVVISAIAYAALNGLIEAKIHTDKVADDSRLEMLFSRQLSDDIHAIIPRTVKNEFGATLPAVVGRFTSLSFTRNGNNNPFLQQKSDLQRVKWYVQDAQLFRESIDYVDAASLPQWKKRQYLQDVADFNISYVASNGVESRNWPLTKNSTMPLRFILITIMFDNRNSLQYKLRAGR